MKNTLTATTQPRLRRTYISRAAHKFNSAVEAVLFGNGVPVPVYEQLIEAVHEKLPVLRRYLDMRKRALGVDTLEMYDLYVPMIASCVYRHVIRRGKGAG
jgi:oligoendopeptidase F